jgi:hypothetical protein
MATSELLPLKRRLQVIVAMFVAFYTLGIIFVASAGLWQYVVCSLTLRWMLQLGLPLILDVPMILAIVYLHHKTYSEEKKRDSTAVSLDK